MIADTNDAVSQKEFGCPRDTSLRAELHQRVSESEGGYRAGGLRLMPAGLVIASKRLFSGLVLVTPLPLSG